MTPSLTGSIGRLVLDRVVKSVEFAESASGEAAVD